MSTRSKKAKVRPARSLAVGPGSVCVALSERQRQLGITRYEVAKRAHLFPSAAYRVLDGKTVNPKLDNLVQIADALGLEVTLTVKHGTPLWRPRRKK